VRRVCHGTFHFLFFYFVSSIASEIVRERDLVQIYDGVLRGAAVVDYDDDDDDDHEEEEDDEDDGDEGDHREASYTYWMIIILMNTRHDSTSQSAENRRQGGASSPLASSKNPSPIILPIYMKDFSIVRMPRETRL